MLDENTKKSLVGYGNRKNRISQYAILLIPFFLFFVSCYNIYLAFKIGHIEGYALRDFLAYWNTETDPQQTYTFSGVFLLAMHKFNSSLFGFSLLIPFGITYLGYFLIKRRDKKIIEVLRKHGEL